MMFTTLCFGKVFRENKEIAKLFKDKNVEGTLIIYDDKKDEYTGYNLSRGKERFVPASTFKIFNTLIGMDSKVVKNVDEMFYKYDGSKVFLESWAKDSNLRYAIKVSQVPAYQLLARKIGLNRMRKNIQKLHYGNMNIGDKVDRFWLDGPLEISAVEQVNLLTKLAKRELPYSKEIQDEVIDITTLDRGKNWELHGKTGWSKPVGWFIGWVKYNGNIYSFALNMKLEDSKDLPLREELVKESLYKLDHMNKSK